MLADDFSRRVTLDPLGAHVPARDAAFRIEHEDRVVLNAFDHQPQSLFALPQRLFGLPAFGQIARDFEKAAQLAMRRSQRGDDDVGPDPRAVFPQSPAFVLKPPVCGGSPQLFLRPAPSRSPPAS